jgi:protein O-mannosyl-transferase
MLLARTILPPQDSKTLGQTSISLFYRILISLLLCISIGIVYWKVTGFEFVSYDDYSYVSQNPFIRHGITLDGIQWAFMKVYSYNWHPLTWISHMLDVELFGLNPGFHHLTNVILHMLNSILLFLVLEKMTGAMWRSSAVAALFALHPLHVESVAWIAERKDVLSTFFWMLTMAGYLRYVHRRTVFSYLVVFFSYMLGLLSKPMLVTLPFVLLLMDLWPLNRLAFFQQGDSRNDNLKVRDESTGRFSRLRPLILEKVPLIILAMISCGITIYAQKRSLRE